MPVTINMFLKQVHHKLWNGCAFVINAMHIFQAGPHKYENERYVPNHPDLLGNFKEAKLDKIPFQEYSEQYPHEQYTLGLAGRPGGPDFYINKVNNTKNHGPGGQRIHDLHEEADPCFGKVVKGIDLLDEINKIPIDYTAGNLLKYHVLIVDAKMITEEHNPLEEGREHPVDDDYTKNHVAGGDSVGRVEEEVRDE
jgi:cyclophilin family peptidyl-prolyl cis-trans isomerase